MRGLNFDASSSPEAFLPTNGHSLDITHLFHRRMHVMILPVVLGRGARLRGFIDASQLISHASLSPYRRPSHLFQQYPSVAPQYPKCPSCSTSTSLQKTFQHLELQR